VLLQPILHHWLRIWCPPRSPHPLSLRFFFVYCPPRSVLQLCTRPRRSLSRCLPLGRPLVLSLSLVLSPPVSPSLSLSTLSSSLSHLPLSLMCLYDYTNFSCCTIINSSHIILVDLVLWVYWTGHQAGFPVEPNDPVQF